MSVSATSTKQFGHLFGKEQGFSTDAAGNSPTSGYMVALQGSEETHAAPLLHPEHLDQYRQKHAATLSEPGMHMGGWNDTDRGAVDLDTSINMPSGGPVRRAEAHGAMITHGQRSLYNVDTGDLEWNNYYGLSKQQAHARIKSEYEEAARGHR
jgi:hypothetical protein